MALVSILPLSSKSVLHKSWIVSTYEHKAIRRTIPNPGLRGRGKSVTPSLRMSLSTAVSDDHGVQRRIVEFHSNLWDDDFIQSLSTPYGAPSYRERADRLIVEVKGIFTSISAEDGELITPLNDLIQRLLMVDNVERLGIDRHFKNEIKAALDYVYSYWNEKGIGSGSDSGVADLNSTAMGFRILRLHGYSVSSDVLEHFKEEKEKEKGQFVCSAIQTEEEIKSVLNLFRASLIAFPGEKVMEEAEIFSKIYLKEALQNIAVSSLSREIEYVLEDGWQTNMPRLETRNYIDVLGENDRDETLYMNMEKLLEIAKVEWWKDSGFSHLTFSRHRHVEFYALASCIETDPKHSGFRLGFAKMCHLITVLDDIYDTFGTMEELELFTAAVKRWDPSATDLLPEYMKGLYMVVYETVNEIAREADKSQGRETLNDARRAWEAYLDSYMKEAEWISSGYLPTFEEYMETSKVSFGYRIFALQPILTMDVPLTHHILQEIDFPLRFNDLICSILRLKNDTRCYKADRARGEEASCISCYMKENPGSTEEDAINHINAMVNNLIKEVNWELLRQDGIAHIACKKHAFDILRGSLHGYKYRDGFSVANKETKNWVRRTVLESVPL